MLLKAGKEPDKPESCLWQRYIEDRENTQLAAGKTRSQLRLTVALREEWGEKSLRYHKGLTRAQSTMLFQCRAEFIGLKCHLFRIKLGDTPYCRCNKCRETPFHLFVECPLLESQRESLFLEFQRNSFSTLITVDGRVAADWAITYFDIEQFDNVRKKSTTFDFDPSFISPREERIATSNSPQSTLPGQTLVLYANGITLLDSVQGPSTTRRAVPTALFGVPADLHNRSP